MRLGFGLPLALSMHAALVAGAVLVFPSTIERLDVETIIVPIEIVEISDTANLRSPQPEPVETPEDETVEEAPPPEEETEPEPPPPDPEETPNAAEDQLGEDDETIESSEPEPEPEDQPEAAETPTPDATPVPTPTPDKVATEEEDPRLNSSFADRALQSAREKQAQRIADREARKAADLKKVEDANKSKRSAGDRERDTATWNDLLRTRLNKCWRDPSDMANAERLRATYQIFFNRDGSIQGTPKRVRPAQISSGDQQMQVFNINAIRAIEKCAPYDDIFPPEHYEEWKEFTFNFGIAIE